MTRPRIGFLAPIMVIGGLVAIGLFLGHWLIDGDYRPTHFLLGLTLFACASLSRSFDTALGIIEDQERLIMGMARRLEDRQ